FFFFFFQAEDGIRDRNVTGVQTCALPIYKPKPDIPSAKQRGETMVKAGIYLVARFTPLFGGGDVWFWLVGGIGLLTLFWGSFFEIGRASCRERVLFLVVVV